MVFDQHEDARQVVAHEVLRAEAERHAEHGGARKQRRQVEPENSEDGESRDAEHDRRDPAAQDRAEGPGALRPALQAGRVHGHGRLVHAGAGGHRQRRRSCSLGDLVDQPAQDGPHQQREDDDEQDPARLASRAGQVDPHQLRGVRAMAEIPGEATGDPWVVTAIAGQRA